MKVAVVDMAHATPEERDEVAAFALAMYANEPCRICRRLITLDETRNLVFTGYVEIDGKTSRASHKACWRDLGPDGQAALRRSVEEETYRDMQQVLDPSQAGGDSHG